jgi:hypothetical protein
MKKYLRMLLLTIIVSSMSLAVSAQDEEVERPKTYPTPKWISEKGYWQVESNVKTPRNSIIYFYNNDHVLVYKEKVERVRLKLNKKRVLMCLKTVLEQTVTAWEQKHQPEENRALLAVELRR